MDDPQQTAAPSWIGKFRHAFRGTWLTVRDQSSMWVHLTFAVGVALAAWMLGVPLWRWCVLLLCVALVLAAEMLNTALERLAKAVDADYNEHVRDALDIGSAAVLVAAAGAALVGALVFLL
jgi:diacylglycerol kinase